MDARNPRIVIVGAGMAGVSAAYHLQRAVCPEASFDLTVLEASQRIGGRICTTYFGGDQVELGATWIHGIEGSPLYNMAQRIDALKGDVPWERQDGFPGKPIVRAEGGLIVDSSIIEPVEDLYKKLTLEARGKAAVDTVEKSKKHQSVGSFLRERFNDFLAQQTNVSELERLILFNRRNGTLPIEGHENHFIWGSSCGWNVRSLQDGVFSVQEYSERVLTSVDSLTDLDLEAEKEYKEYGGEHITIGKGYLSVVNELAKWLPASTIQFGKKVSCFSWKNSHPSSGAPVVVHCEDGSSIEADHVIVTVSLGILKASTRNKLSESLPVVSDGFAWNAVEGSRVCKSVGDLRGGLANDMHAHQLFEPPLPSWKLEAISRLGFGVVNKLFLLLEPSAGEQLRSHMEFIYNKELSNKGIIPLWMRNIISLCPIYKDSSVLLCWFAGQEALDLEGLSDDEIIDGVVDTLARFGLSQSEACVNGVEAGRRDGRGEMSDSEESSDDSERGMRQAVNAWAGGHKNIRSMFRGVLRSSWGTNPLFHGSYSFVATGSSGLDIDALSEPLPMCEARDAARESPSLQLLFAGEATERHFYSTTHGAFLSGAREANRLLHHYGFSGFEPV